VGIGIGQLYCGRIRRAGALILLYALALLFFDNVFSLSSSVGFYLSFLLFTVIFLIACAVDSWRIARRIESIQIRWFNRWYIYLGLFLVISSLGNLGIRGMETKWRSFYAANESMEPTLTFGERWFAKMAVSPTEPPPRGTVIVLRNPRRPDQDWVRRLIGLPGDTIQLVYGKLYVNGSAAERREIQRTTDGRIQYQEILPSGHSHSIFEYSDGMSTDRTPVFRVPHGHVFVLGDNRDRSKDSRHPELGTVPIANIKGFPEVIYWSGDRKRIGREIH
jgi:signal peptidase I